MSLFVAWNLTSTVSRSLWKWWTMYDMILLSIFSFLSFLRELTGDIEVWSLTRNWVELGYTTKKFSLFSSCYFSAIFCLKASLWNTGTRTELNVASETRWSTVIIATANAYLLSGFECMLLKLFMSLYYLKDCNFVVCRFKMLLHLKGKKCRMSVFHDSYQFFDCGKHECAG